MMDIKNTNTSKIATSEQVSTSKNPVKKKKIGCLGCFGYILLTLVIVGIVFFAVRAVQSKMKERETQKLKARFTYTEKYSAEHKLTQAFEKGEISADTYIMQLAYSIFDKDKLDTKFKFDNEVDFVPDIVGLFIKHMDEVSEETAEYVVRNTLLPDIRIHPDASRNPVAYEKRWSPFSEYVFANGYDVTVLDKAFLSPSGKFLIWYTQTGESAVEEDTIKKLAESVDDIADKIENFLEVDWSYEYTKINSGSYKDMKEVLDKCGIDEKVISEALPIFIYEAPNNDGALAWYCKNVDLLSKIAIKLGKMILSDDDVKELSSVYTLPYIVIKTSSISNMESLQLIFAHELTHHFQRIYYDDLSYNADGFTSETVANFVAASIIDAKGTESVLNDHANQYIEVADSFLARLESKTTKGYLEFVWAKSYTDIVKNGNQYLKESLLQDNPYLYLSEKAGDSYHLVLEDLAVRNITKDYKEKGFVSTVLPKPKDHIDRYMDSVYSSILANCFHYYYIDSKDYSKSETIIQMKNKGEKKIFVKILGRKRNKYSLIETHYCEPYNELTIADFSGNDYKKYDEIILVFGNCEPSGSAEYQLSSISSAAIDFYETVTGLQNLKPLEINGDCITIYIDDFVEGATTLTDYFSRAITFIDNNLETEDPEATSEYFNYLKDEIDTIGEAVKKFGNIFEYRTLRLYMIPIENTKMSDKELHDMALSMMPKLKFKVIDAIDDGTHVTSGFGIQPFSNTQIIAYAMLTSQDGEKIMYRIEFDK